MNNSTPRTMIDQLRFRAGHDADTVGYTFLTGAASSGESLTYGELDRQARTIAVALQRITRRGERALLMYPPGLDFVSAFFGCLYAGVLAVPAYPPHFARPQRTLPRLRAIAGDAGVDTILCTTDIARRLPLVLPQAPELAGCSVQATDAATMATQTDEDDWKALDVKPQQIAFLQYTSGSTAAPKGVMVSHRNIMHNLAQLELATRHDADSVEISWLPTYHDMGLFAGVLFPLLKGCPSLLMSPVSFLQEPLRWLQTISDYRGTNSGGPNFAYDLCVRRTTPEQRERLDLSSWRIAYNGAEPIRRQTLEQFCEAFGPSGFRRSTFHPVYGLAEATVFVSGRRLDDRADLASPLAPVSCGSPDHDTEVAIVDHESKTKVAPGDVGELWLRSDSIAAGYWNRPSESAQTFAAYLADTGDGPFLRTGDLGFVRNGELFITGRIKDLIIVRGGKHYPQDIEQTVEASHASVLANGAVALAVPTDDGERLAVLAEVNPRLRRVNTPQTVLEDIVGSIREAVADQHELQTYCIWLVPRGSIPKTSSGKTQRHVCRERMLTGTLEHLAQWTLCRQPHAEPIENSQPVECV